MRSTVYRNLDRPFQVLGFSSHEIVLLCFALVLGGELFQMFFFSRAWAFLLTGILMLSLYWIRKSLGEGFIARLFRFMRLPNHLNSQLLRTGRRI